MSFGLTMLVFFLIILLIIGVSLIIDRNNSSSYDDYEEESSTITTTTTVVQESNQIQTVGTLNSRKAKNGQRYVIDPTDHDKMWVNTNDDLYEDGSGKIYNLTHN